MLKIGIFVVAILTITGHHTALCQDENLPEEERAFRINSIVPPSGLAVFHSQRTTSSATVGWSGDKDATSFTLRVYTRSDGVLYQEIQNILLPIYNITDLMSGTEYAVTVSVIYTGGTGQQLESVESDPVFIQTVRKCTGGQVRTRCNAHCISTCDNPDPICSRICTSGCGCPHTLPIWHENTCLPRQLCPPPRGRPITPKNVRILPNNDNDDIFLTWDPIDNAMSYTVRVKPAVDRSTVVRTLESTFPLVVIRDLSKGEIYIFSVKANMRKQPVITSRSALLPPNGARVSRISDTTFQVSWDSRSEATRYAFILYDESRENVLYLNEKIAGNTMEVEGLAPGTLYYYSVATAGSQRNPAIFSNLRGVMTRGQRAKDLDAYHSTEIVESLVPSVVPTTTERTTTTTTTTTAAPTMPPRTMCQERYASVESFYQSFPGVDGPSYPKCDSEGRFVTVQCFPDAPNVCWCIDAENGEKLRGSDFGGPNSGLRLNCDRFGSFFINRISIEIDQVKSTSLRVRWSRVSNIHGYVIVLENVDDNEILTISVNSNVHFRILSDLVSGQTYNIGVFAVNDNGWASSISHDEVTTNFVDTPEDLQISDMRENSATVLWRHSTNAESYQVRVIVTSTGRVFRTFNAIMSNSLTINGLDMSVAYKIEVRAQMNTVDSNSVRVSHVSDAASIALTPRDCDQSRPVDVIFVLDSSRVSSFNGFQAQKRLFMEITKRLPKIDLKTGTRIAIVKYYRRASAVFSFNRFRRANNVLTTLTYLPNDQNSELFTARMLSYLTSTFFTNQNRGPSYTIRPDATSVAIIFSGGSSENSIAEVREAASELKAVTNVIAVGIDGRSDDNELSTIASRPDLIVKASSLNDLNKAINPILSKFCTLQ